MLLASLPGFTWGQAANVALTAMGTALVIMVAMVILLGFLEKYASGAGGGQKAAAGVKPAPAKAAPVKKSVPSPAAKEVAAAQGAEQDDSVPAAIAAAVYSYLQTEAPSYKAGRINITSREPVVTAARSNWQLAGRRSLLENRSDFAKMRRRKA